MTAPNLAQRLLAANKELGWIAKGERNKDQGYDYATASSVFAAAREALHNHGVLWFFSTTDHNIDVLDTPKGTRYLHRLTGEYSFINVDEPKDVLSGTVQGSTIAIGDKGAWVTTTGLLKYALIQTLLLPTGDDPEAQPENAPAERKPGATAPANPPAATKAPDVKVGLTEPQRKKLFARLDELGITVADSKRFVFRELTGKHSTKEMSGNDLDKILQFFAEKSDATEEMVVKAMAAA